MGFNELRSLKIYIMSFVTVTGTSYLFSTRIIRSFIPSLKLLKLGGMELKMLSILVRYNNNLVNHM